MSLDGRLKTEDGRRETGDGRPVELLSTASDYL